MSNHLNNQTSPYLLQHAENSVDWFAWCDEAFEKAKKEDKPIFLSIGYSTCHWCHVMAHESFEDEETANILNEKFVSIKVDREERPDIDSVYMAVCQSFTGSGGWPTSIFMTPEQKPFYAGTYFPLKSRYGVVGFKDLLNAISQQWEDNRAKMLQSADEIINHIDNKSIKQDVETDESALSNAVEIFRKMFDSQYGGFGVEPKFPTPHNLLFLMLYSKMSGDKTAMEMAEKTLYQMRIGGIFDHIGYGFSRYSTDRYFLAPHFEKMLYDNALLLIAYSSAYKLTKNHIYLDTAKKTAEYVTREMISEEGGFYCAQDADSDGEEGKFYTFSYDEILQVLGKDIGEKFCSRYDITHEGNFEGKNILNLIISKNINDDFSEELAKLYEYRKNRNDLHFDDKILTSWNSLMIIAFSVLYRVTNDNSYLLVAEKAQNFIENNLLDNKNLYVSFRKGTRTQNGFLDDYAFYVASLIELYQSTLNKDYLCKAEEFCEIAIEKFFDEKNGGFYLCDKNDNKLLFNPIETYDGAMPSGNSVMACNLVRLSQLISNQKYEEVLDKHFKYLSTQAWGYPHGHSMFLIGLIQKFNPPASVKIVLKNISDIEKSKTHIPFLANVELLKRETDDYPMLKNKTTIYICENNTCKPPFNI